MDDFLEKPLRAQTLSSLLNLHVRRSQEASPLESRGGRPGNETVVATALEQLKAEIGTEATLDLAREYLSSVKRTIERLSQPDPLDAERVRSAAHQLLGGARVLGLVRFERIWAPLADGNAATDSMPSTVVPNLREACADLTAWIDSHQRQHNV